MRRLAAPRRRCWEVQRAPISRFSAFRNSFFPAQIAAIKDEVEALRARSEPDLVLTHCRDDLHQDHRVINELSWNAFRDHLLLEYEIPKYDGDLGRPNFYVPLSEALATPQGGYVDGLLRFAT